MAETAPQPDRARLREVLADFPRGTVPIFPEELKALLDRLDELEAENRLLREEIRIREESQIPVIPRAAAERMAKLEAENERLEIAVRAAEVFFDISREALMKTPLGKEETTT